MKKGLRNAVISILIIALAIAGIVILVKHMHSGENNHSMLDGTQEDQREPGEGIPAPGGNPPTGENSEENGMPDENGLSEGDILPGNQNDEKTADELQIDLEKIKPNEAGKIMVVMFHNFVESFEPTKYDDGQYTITFKAFEELLHTLYEKGYRLISFKDFIDNNINVPAGCIPMVFTFDDGTRGQFSLVEEDGVLKAERKSAVGIMEEFCSKYPDFGLKGTFFVNMGTSVFSGGSLQQRLQYLIDKGFEIGNHTFNHVNLLNVKSSEEIQYQLGANQKKIYELGLNYKMFAFSLPYGNPAKEFREYLIKGKYEDVEYENLAIVEVGWNPAPSPADKDFNPYSIPRVRAPGINPERFDLNWWLENLSREEQYISDGNPDTITVPESKAGSIDTGKIQNKKLIVY